MVTPHPLRIEKNKRRKKNPIHLKDNLKSLIIHDYW